MTASRLWFCNRNRRSHGLVKRVSPDGKWLAYSSTDSGKEEVYVTPFPSASGRWQISQNGGGYPIWRGDSKELFFAELGDGAFHAVEVKINGNQFEAGNPQSWFIIRATSSIGYPYDVAPDGQRFLVPMPRQSISRRLCRRCGCR